MNEQEIRQHFENQQWIETKIREVAIAVMTHRAKDLRYVRSIEHNYYGNFEIDGETISAEFDDTHCSSCGPDSTWVYFPLMYLWTEDFMAVETVYWAAEKKTKEDAAAAEKLKEEKERQRKAEERDRANYERLKANYERLKAKYESGLSGRDIAIAEGLVVPGDN
jgi:hypothetical protein